MEKYLFDVKKQLGLSRICQVRLGEKKCQTPILLLPSIINNLLSQNDPIFQNFPQKPNKGGNKFPFIGSLNYDPLNIIQAENDHLNDHSPLLPIFFRQSKSQWGIPYNEEKVLETEIKNHPEIPILNANFPNKYYFRLEKYNKEAIKTRFKLYQEIIFRKQGEAKFVIEINFSNLSEEIDYFITFIKKYSNQIIGIKISGLFSNLMRFQEILEWIFRFKKETPSDLVWILGGDCAPQYYALAVYLGFDIIDLSKLLQTSLEGVYFHQTGRKWLRELQYPLCGCPVCQQIECILPGKFHLDWETTKLVLQHNLFLAKAEIQRLREEIRSGTLRSYVEMQIHSDPLAASLLRWIDLHYNEPILDRYPIIADHPVMSIGPESYHRPEVSNYINRLKQQSTPAKDYKLIVILPCSAHKPYAKSQSHSRFIHSLRKIAKQAYSEIHQVIITSPIGVVPRELETIFPVAHYDIPVTGNWDTQEIEMTGNLLAHWLKKYKKQNQKTQSILQVLVHVSGGYYQAAKKAEKLLFQNLDPVFQFHYTLSPNERYSPSSSEGIAALEQGLQKILPSVSNIKEKSSIEKIKELTSDEIKLRALLDYQFGAGVGEFVVKRGVILSKSRNPQYDDILVFDGSDQLKFGRVMKNTGLIKLHSEGAYFLMEEIKSIITITDKDMHGTTIFAPILKQISPFIHPDDEVIVLNSEGQYIGHGQAIQSSLDTQSIRYGRVCSLRKKVEPRSSASDILINLTEGDL